MRYLYYEFTLIFNFPDSLVVVALFEWQCRGRLLSGNVAVSMLDMGITCNFSFSASVVLHSLHLLSLQTLMLITGPSLLMPFGLSVEANPLLLVYLGWI
jgi:hypothetical protein